MQCTKIGGDPWQVRRRKGVGWGYFRVPLASWTFAHRTLAIDWHFIDAYQVNRSFKDLIFPALCSRVNCLFGHIRFVVPFLMISFILGRLSLLRCIFTCNSTFYSLEIENLHFFHSAFENVHYEFSPK